MKQKLLLILMIVSFCTGFAQGSRTQSGPIIVTDVNPIVFSNGMTARSVSPAAGTTIDANRLKELITQVQPACYFYDGEVKTYGDAPTNLFTDLSSLRTVNSSITLKNNIEIATIRINTSTELNSTIDLSAFSNFPNLKYIYFISGLNTTSDAISRNIINYNSRYNILYKIDQGDRNPKN